MTTYNRNNTVSRQLFILSAGLLLQAHSAFASDPSDDAQAQPGALLDPPVVHQVIAAQGTASSPTKDRTLVYPDAQESARAFLSSRSIRDGAAQPATAHGTGEGRPLAASDKDRRVSSDPQEAVRRMILGLGAAPAVAHSDAAAREIPAVGTLSAR
jgi:hypothetical protein